MSNATKLSIDVSTAGLPAGTPVYAYIIGLVETASGNVFYRLDASGMPQPMRADDVNKKSIGHSAKDFPGSMSLPATAKTELEPNYPSAWADYSIPVSLNKTLEINLGNINETTCPGLGVGTAAFSGRIYLSVGTPILPISPVGKLGKLATGYTAPIFNAPPGFLTLFDWVEFSYDKNSDFNGNTTQVDQFGFGLTLDGSPGGKLQGVLTESSEAVKSTLGYVVKPFKKNALQILVPKGAEAAYPKGLEYLRVISPKTFAGDAASKTFFDTIIKDSYQAWETIPLVTYDKSTKSYTGVVPTSGVNIGELVFYEGKYLTMAALASAKKAGTLKMAFVFGKVTTQDVWQCAGTLAAGGAAQKNVGKMIAAAFNRGVMSNYLDDAHWSEQEVAGFYHSTEVCNNWSKLFHEFNANKLAYGFPYDDVGDQNPSISIQGATSIAITIGPMLYMKGATPFKSKVMESPEEA